ncbi:MAG: class I SAM-dependent DNA methyltransferase [Acidimicrobiia bacterium]
MTDFALFDRRHYPTVSVRDGYRDWVGTYDGTVEDIMDLALLDRIETVDWAAARRAADLGCGTGRTARWLAAHGVRDIDGVDLSPEMIEVARASGHHRSVTVADVRDSGLPRNSYDLVVAGLVDEHLPSLVELYGEAHRLSRAGAAFVVVGFHPFFIMASGMPTHFEADDRGPVAIETYVHLPSSHVAAARAAGFVLEEMHEQVVDDRWIERKPRWERHRGWPISFASVWRVDELIDG